LLRAALVARFVELLVFVLAAGSVAVFAARAKDSNE
jgi:hypothetical protein